jgi:hypothetical protein
MKRMIILLLAALCCLSITRAADEPAQKKWQLTASHIKSQLAKDGVRTSTADDAKLTTERIQVAGSRMVIESLAQGLNRVVADHGTFTDAIFTATADTIALDSASNPATFTGHVIMQGTLKPKDGEKTGTPITLAADTITYDYIKHLITLGAHAEIKLAGATFTSATGAVFDWEQGRVELRGVDLVPAPATRP